MSNVEPHPTDEGKFQSTVDEYGHGEGNGRSRSAVYKHLKNTVIEVSIETAEVENDSAGVEPEPSHIIDEGEEPTDFVQDEETEWGHVEWADPDEVEPKPRRIPRAVSDMARGKAKIADAAATGTIIRFGYHTLDRAITHWGRAVMNKPEWDIDRSKEDMDTLEIATMGMLDHYGVTIPMSPVVIWGAAVGSAYVPPLVHIKQNADPARKRTNWLGSIFKRFRRKKKEAVQIDEPVEP